MQKKLAILTIVILMGSILAGCIPFFNRYINFGESEKGMDEPKQSKQEKILTIDPDPKPEEKDIILYFKHAFSDYLVPEERKAQRDKQSLERLVVEELLKGPEAHNRISVMPPGVKVLDVTRKGNTVFVNLSEEFNGDVDLSTIPDKKDTPQENRPVVLAGMKRLAIYSIVNSLTELNGVNQVKILVNNRAIGYEDMGEELAKLLTNELPTANQNNTALMLVALSRNKEFILSPAKSVELLYEGLRGEPKWDMVYSLLASELENGDKLPPKEELQKLWAAYVSSIEFEDNFIKSEEIKPDGSAFVTVNYTVTFTSGKKEKRENYLIRVKVEDGETIWKVVLPDFVAGNQ